MNEELHRAKHAAHYLAQVGCNMKVWLSELEKQKRDAGLTFIADRIRSDITSFENASKALHK